MTVQSNLEGANSVEAILGSYPRSRPPLTPAHEKVYAEQYKINRDGATTIDGAAQKLEEWMHRKIAAVEGAPVLELGAGTLNHLRFEREGEAYDVVEPFRALYEGRPVTARVREFFDGAQDVPLDHQYKRIISVAVLEHLPDLPADVARSALLLDDAGVFQAGIPSEGGFLWWMGWRFATGLDYGVLMRHEHINDAKTILAVTRHFFEEVRVSRFPTPLHQLSFYTYLEARKPRRDVAQAYLDSLK
jgi:hypothetical protein